MSPEPTRLESLGQLAQIHRREPIAGFVSPGSSERPCNPGTIEILKKRGKRKISFSPGLST
jgi:hypothetical protein